MASSVLSRAISGMGFGGMGAIYHLYRGLYCPCIAFQISPYPEMPSILCLVIHSDTWKAVTFTVVLTMQSPCVCLNGGPSNWFPSGHKNVQEAESNASSLIVLSGDEPVQMDMIG